MQTKKYTEARGAIIMMKLNTIYDMLLEIESMPIEVLAQLGKLQTQLEIEFADMAYEQSHEVE